MAKTNRGGAAKREEGDHPGGMRHRPLSVMDFLIQSPVELKLSSPGGMLVVSTFGREEGYIAPEHGLRLRVVYDSEGIGNSLKSISFSNGGHDIVIDSGGKERVYHIYDSFDRMPPKNRARVAHVPFEMKK